MGLADTFFVGEGRLAAGQGPCTGRRYAPTERCPHRAEVNQGTVNDDNAWAVGGVAGHAGLFSTAGNVARLGQEWLLALEGRGRILDAKVAREFARRDPTPGSERALAWDTPSAPGSAPGRRRVGGDVLDRVGAGTGTAWRDRPPGLHGVLPVDRPGPADWSARCSRTTSSRGAGGRPRSWPCGRPFTTRRRGRWGERDGGRGHGGGLEEGPAGAPHRGGRDRDGLLRRDAQGGGLRGDRVGRERLSAHVHAARALGHRGHAGLPAGEPRPGPARRGRRRQRRARREPRGRGHAGARAAPRVVPAGPGRALHRPAPRRRGGGDPRQDHHQRHDGVPAAPRRARSVLPGGRGHPRLRLQLPAGRRGGLRRRGGRVRHRLLRQGAQVPALPAPHRHLHLV